MKIFPKLMFRWKVKSGEPEATPRPLTTHIWLQNNLSLFPFGMRVVVFALTKSY